jgi:group I intron endonuclease
MTIGIYCIKNSINNMLYIGQSINIEKRIVKHKRKLLIEKHENIYLQRVWNKYGKDNFEFFSLESCDKSLLDEREIYYIGLFDSMYPKGYNLNTGGNSNKEISQEVRNKIGDGNRGKTVSEEAKEKISKNNARWNLGKHLSEETKKRISESHKGQIPWNKGIPTPEETKKKISEATIGREPSKETTEKIARALQGKRVGKTGYHGVYKIKENTKKRFRAEIKFQNKKYRLGNYLTPEEAARAYDEKAIELYGEDASLNFSK